MALQLNLGSGDTKIPGFISVDLYDERAEVRADICQLPYGDSTVDAIVCYQAIEHIPYWRSEDMLRDWYRVLKPQATAIIETPDIDVVCQKILQEGLQDKWVFNLVGQYYRPWDKERYIDWENHAGSIHRNPWNDERLRRIAHVAGFIVERRTKADYYSEFEETGSWLLTKS